MQQQGLPFSRRYVPGSTFPTSECVPRINLISRQNEGLPHHTSTSSLTHKAKFPILRSQKGFLITQHLYLTHLAMHYDKPIANDELKQAIEPYGRRVCLAHDGLCLAF
jgi:hypothetical protein